METATARKVISEPAPTAGRRVRSARTGHRPADCNPGTGTTDARDAFVIADAARIMPHLLHTIDPDESVRAELTMVLGRDDDLAQDATRTSNRLRGLLTSIHPALERVLGPRLRHPAVLAPTER